MYKKPNECYKRRRRIIGRKRIKTLERVLTTINVMTTNNFWFNFLVSYYYIGMVQTVFCRISCISWCTHLLQTDYNLYCFGKTRRWERLCVLCRQVLWENFFEHIMALKELYILEYHKNDVYNSFLMFLLSIFSFLGYYKNQNILMLIDLHQECWYQIFQKTIYWSKLF